MGECVNIHSFDNHVVRAIQESPTSHHASIIDENVHVSNILHNLLSNFEDTFPLDAKK
jgi:hypothetical protein